jgi:hypothetical protein
MNHIEASLARTNDATAVALRAALAAQRAKVAEASMGYGFAAAVACAAATAVEATVTSAYLAYVTFGDAPPAALLAANGATPRSPARVALKGASKAAKRLRGHRWHAAVRFSLAAVRFGIATN